MGSRRPPRSSSRTAPATVGHRRPLSVWRVDARRARHRGRDDERRAVGPANLARSRADGGLTNRCDLGQKRTTTGQGPERRRSRFGERRRIAGNAAEPEHGGQYGHHEKSNRPSKHVNTPFWSPHGGPMLEASHRHHRKTRAFVAAVSGYLHEAIAPIVPANEGATSCTQRARTCPAIRAVQ